MAKKLSQYGDASALTGTEKIPVLQSGNKNATPDQVKTYVLTGLDIGVETVTGDLVDNADPGNPVIDLPENVTTQGNSFNGVSQLVKTEASGKLPAIDGSQLTNLPVQSVTGDLVDAGDPANPVIDLPANVTTEGNTFNGADQLVQLDGTGKLPAIDGSQLTNLPDSGVQGLTGNIVDNTDPANPVVSVSGYTGDIVIAGTGTISVANGLITAFTAE